MKGFSAFFRFCEILKERQAWFLCDNLCKYQNLIPFLMVFALTFSYTLHFIVVMLSSFTMFTESSGLTKQVYLDMLFVTNQILLLSQIAGMSRSIMSVEDNLVLTSGLTFNTQGIGLSVISCDRLTDLLCKPSHSFPS